MVYKITECRACKSKSLHSIIDLGTMAFTGIFPKTKEEVVPEGPLEVVTCGQCGLTQLAHNFEEDLLFGESYGYRSGLNSSMVRHLLEKAEKLSVKYKIGSGSVVVDIGSNDGTFSRFLPETYATVCIDPLIKSFDKYYPENVIKVPVFFTADDYRRRIPFRKVNLVTSIACYYDMKDPVQFAREITELLDRDGVWHLEVANLPAMIGNNSYDTICHEHLEYYCDGSLTKIFNDVGLKVIDYELNKINGGSVAVTVAKMESKYDSAPEWYTSSYFMPEVKRVAFRNKVSQSKKDLLELIHSIKQEGKTVLGLGASTKGNTILQYCGLTEKEIPFIADVNEDKIGRFTPGTKIPIISEKDARAMKPDYFLVLPWHFRDSIIEREKEFWGRGGKLIFPLPEVEVFGNDAFGL